MEKRWDTLWISDVIATCEKNKPLLTNASIAIKNGVIAWVGELSALPAAPDALANTVYYYPGKCITPGFIDCHTHLVYAGNRAREFEQRLAGVSYAEIAKQGGGIQSTVKATRTATDSELLNQSLARAQALLMSGVTTLEIKSGYGLNIETECKQLRIAEQIADILALTVKKTFLGAHTVPPEYRDEPDRYVEYVCNDMLPLVAEKKLADAVDVFCENIAFTVLQTEKIFKAAKKYHLGLKCHADQLSTSSITTLAAHYPILSFDHLEYTDENGVANIARAGSTAVLLPGAYYFLREKQLPPIALLRAHQVPIALASDCNPGTSPILSMLIILNMACTLFRLTPEEALQGVTCHAARALGLEKTHGTLTIGKVADLAIWDVADPSELIYYLGGHPLFALIKAGKCIYQK